MQLARNLCAARDNGKALRRNPPGAPVLVATTVIPAALPAFDEWLCRPVPWPHPLRAGVVVLAHWPKENLGDRDFSEKLRAWQGSIGYTPAE